MKSTVYFFFLFCSITLYSWQATAQKNDKKKNPFLYIEKDTNAVIATSSLPLTKTLPECNLGNIITDAFVWYATQKNIQNTIAFLPYSSIKIEYISPGAITVGTIKQILPQKSQLVIAAITGKQLVELCQSLANKGGGCVAGITFTIEANKAIDIKANNEEVNANIYYSIILPEFLLNNENYYSYLYKSKYTKLYVTLSEAVISFLQNQTKQGNTINTAIEGRIKYIEQ